MASRPRLIDKSMSEVRRSVVQRKEMPQVDAASNVPADPLQALRDRTWGTAAEWEAAGYPWLAAVLKGAIALSKGER